MARANSFTKVLKLSSGLKTAVYVLQNISQKFACSVSFNLLA